MYLRDQNEKLRQLKKATENVATESNFTLKEFLFILSFKAEEDPAERKHSEYRFWNSFGE